MPDGNLSIGVIFEKAKLEGDFTDASEIVKAAVDGISTVFESSKKSVRDSADRIIQATREMGQSITPASLAFGEGCNQIKVDLQLVRDAAVLAKNGVEGASVGMAIAQQKLAADQAAQASRLEAMNAEIAATAKAAALSPNWIVAGFQKAEMQIKASLTGVQEKLVQTAETSKLSAEGMTEGFAGFGKLLGAGMFAGFALHSMDGIAKLDVELDHLHEKTGISVRDLSGLQQVVKESGADWDQVSTGLIRMDRAMGEVHEGNKAAIKGFQDLGISFEEVEKLTPIEMLKRLSGAMTGQHDATIRAAAAIAIFGRGGAALIPILMEQNAALGVNIEKGAALVEADDKAIVAAKEWTRSMAELSGALGGLGNLFLENIHYAEAFGSAIGTGLDVAFQTLTRSIQSTMLNLKGFGTMIYHGVTGQWSQIPKDWQATNDAMMAASNKGFEEIKSRWKETVELWSGPQLSLSGDEMARRPARGASGGNTPDVKTPKGAKGARGPSALQQDEEDLNELKLSHQVTLEEEIKFWQEKLALATKGTAEYRAIEAKLAPLEQKEDRKPKPADGAAEFQAQAAKEEVAQFKAAFAAIDKVESDSAKHSVEVARTAEEEKMRLKHEDLVDFEQACKNKVALGQMTERQMIAAVTEETKQEQEIRHQASAVIRQLDAGDVKACAADLKKEEADTRDSMRRITQLHQEAAMRFQQNWTKAMDQFNQGFITAMNSVITHSKSLTQAFAQMFNQIIMGVIDMAAKWVLQEAEKWAKLKIMDALGLTTKKATESAANVASTESYTAVAAMAAASAVAGIPIVGPALAAGAAAQMVALGQSFTAMAAFEAGGIVGGRSGMAIPILAHAGERVLSPSQTTNFEKMVNQSSTSSSSKSSTIHNHVAMSLNGYDRAGLKSALRDHADTVLDIVRQGYHSGKLSAA